MSVPRNTSHSPRPSAEQEQVLNSWVGERCQRPLRCPLCGASNQWQIGPIVRMPVLTADGTADATLTGPDGVERPTSYPAITYACGFCGNTLFFAAELLGLFRKRPAAAATGPPSSRT
jgi:hypothetical protein